MNPDHFVPLPACSIAGCQSPCGHSPLLTSLRGITMSHMTPDEGKTITVRLDGDTIMRLAGLADYFMERDPLERDVPTSQVVRQAIQEMFRNHLGPDLNEEDEAVEAIEVRLTSDQIEDLMTVLDFSMRSDPNTAVDQPIPDASASALFDMFEAISGEHNVFESEEEDA